MGEEGTRRYNKSRWPARNMAWAMTVTLANLVSAVPRSNFNIDGRSNSFLGPYNISQLVTLENGMTRRVEVDLNTLPSYAKIEPLYEHNIYEYDFDGTTTKLAWSVLPLHSNAWSQLGDHLTLTLNTRPTSLLRNTGVSVKNWDTWRLIAYVRVSSDGTGVEIDVQDKAIDAPRFDDGRVPQPNQVYG
ncbi:hypothetical protein B0T14DRAFT_559323 [Immersiella caudata]|uniref:Uncharacterized protein n=1 Tax=Immersiella caudata TaxID=314043 RepID=A0AA40CAY0_9PEZI|nr:hypothetical protein B0T14DRAFT_559323 [Immersiella caudata]